MMHTMVIGSSSFVAGVAGAWLPTANAAHTAAMPSIASRRLMCVVDVSAGSTFGSLSAIGHVRFVRYQSMDVTNQADAPDLRIAAIVGLKKTRLFGMGN
jgi:hypothetical protein